MQFLPLFYKLPVYGKILFIIILSVISIWTYRDAVKRGLTGILWGLAVLLFPVILPVYLWIRPPHMIRFCPGCSRIMAEDSTECYFCMAGIPPDRNDFSLKNRIKIILHNQYLIINSNYYKILGFGRFCLKNKFLLLAFKLSSFYPQSMCHQIVINEGRELDIPINTLTYGETSFYSAGDIFSLAKINKDDVFYDIGSGTGNVVFLCNLLYGIKSVGIDAIPTFISQSMKIKEELSFNNVEFINRNFLEEDISDGTVFFIVTTVFDRETRKGLEEKFKDIPSGIRIITVTHKFDVPYLKVVGEKKVFFSWGYETVYLHVKI